MRFIRHKIQATTNPKETLAAYYASPDRRYVVAKSRTGKGWCAFFCPLNSGSSLIGPPADTKEKAQDLCMEHDLALPW